MKFASIQCIKNHHVKDHGLNNSEESGTDDESDDDKSKDLRIITRSMSQISDLKKYRGESKWKINCYKLKLSDDYFKIIYFEIFHLFSIRKVSNEIFKPLSLQCS